MTPERLFIITVLVRVDVSDKQKKMHNKKAVCMYYYLVLSFSVLISKLLGAIGVNPSITSGGS